MKELRENKIWGCITTSKAIETLSKYKFFFANSNHCLVISDEQPEGTVEMTEEFIALFKADDWEWLESVIGEVRRKQLENNPELAEIKRQNDEEFLKRFRQGLTEWRDANGRGTSEDE